jgi:hypothetical protein
MPEETVAQNSRKEPNGSIYRRIRQTIKDARVARGLTEKEVNEAYLRAMSLAGEKAPKAIMTKVRDARTSLEFSRTGAEILSDILRLDPELFFVSEKPEGDPEQTGVREEGNSAEASPSAPRPKEQSRKVSAGFYETPDGLHFLINMELDRERFERLTLSIPEYMMTLEERPGGIYCRAQVPIFPYQAEPIMRAIFGGR